MIRLLINDRELDRLPNGRYEIEEASTFCVMGASSVFREGKELQRDANGCTTVDLRMSIGRTQLVCVVDGQSHAIDVDIVPSSRKITRHLWARMLDDLEQWMPGITAGIGDIREGSVGLRGVSSQFLAEALIPLVSELLEAVRLLCEHLRRRRATTLLDMPAHAARRVRADTVRWLTRHDDVVRRLLGGGERSQKPDRIPLRMPIEDFEHPANRYISWLLLTVQKVMLDVAARLEHHKNCGDGTTWFGDRAAKLSLASSALGQLVRSSALASVQPDPDVSGAITSLLDDPAYARVHRIGRLFVSPAFQLDRDATLPMGSRPSYGIYEIWCFLTLSRALQSLQGFKWTFLHMRQLLELGSSGSGAVAIGKSSSGALELRFNATFRSHHTRDRAKAQFPRWSISSERRPDFAIAWFPTDAPSRWVVLDAKYQSSEQGLAGSMDSLHIYRDALRWEQCGGAPCGGILLAPRCDNAEVYFSADYLAEFGIGVMQACPGADHYLIVQWLTACLDIRSTSA